MSDSSSENGPDARVSVHGNTHEMLSNDSLFRIGAAIITLWQARQIKTPVYDIQPEDMSQYEHLNNVVVADIKAQKVPYECREKIFELLKQAVEKAWQKNKAYDLSVSWSSDDNGVYYVLHSDDREFLQDFVIEHGDGIIDSLAQELGINTDKDSILAH